MKTQVYSTYDANYQTWNVMTNDNVCLFFGDINGLEDWLLDNQDRFIES